MEPVSPRRVLFVCMGNICRSPAGEGVLRHLVAEQGIEDRVEVDSAGTTGHHVGEPPDLRMSRAAASRGYRLDGRSRRFAADDFARFELIVAMDRENLSGVRRSGPGRPGQVRLLSDFLSPEWPMDVPDPYYGGDHGFETVLDMIEAACPAILDQLLRP